MPSSRLLAYFVVISLALLTAARSHPQRRNVGTSTTNRRSQRSDSTEYDGPLNFDGTLLSAMNTSDWNSNKMVKRNHGHDFKTLVLSPKNSFINTWTGPVSISDKTFGQVVFSTGVSNTWIRESFDVHGLPRSSFKQAGYEGEVHEVPVTAAGITVEMAIAHMSKCPDLYETVRLGIGVVGLGLGPGIFFHELGFYEHAIKQKRVNEPVFAFDFGKAQPELHFGGLDKSRVFKAEDWHVLVPFGEARSWVISKGEINIGDEKKGVVQGMRTLIDTSAQGIHGPKDAVKTIFDHIPGSVEDKWHLYAVPCHNLPTISLRWGVGTNWVFKNNSFIVDGLLEDDWYKDNGKDKEKPMCRTVVKVIKQKEKSELYDWKVGIAFLKNVYAAFDMGEHRIGFGE